MKVTTAASLTPVPWWIPAAPFDTEVYSPVSYLFIAKPFEEGKMLHTAYALEKQHGL